MIADEGKESLALSLAGTLFQWVVVVARDIETPCGAHESFYLSYSWQWGVATGGLVGIFTEIAPTSRRAADPGPRQGKGSIRSTADSWIVCKAQERT